MKFSVIIPAYNVEDKISKCLESVFIQDISDYDYEVIIVDDGSTDNTSIVVQNFIKDKKNCILISQDNQKQGAARNTALGIAKGEYIWFIDSDDYIKVNCLEFLYNIVKKNRLDVLFFTSFRKSGDNLIINIKPKFKSIVYNKIYSGQDIIHDKSINCGPCFCIYKRVFLEKYDLRFKENVFYEDNEFMLRIYYFAKRVYYIDFPCYYVNITEGSATRSNTVEPIFDILKVTEFMLEFKNNLSKSDSVIKECSYYSVLTFNTGLDKMNIQNKQIQERFIETLQPIKYKLICAMFQSQHPKYIIEGIFSIISIRLLLFFSKLLK